MGVKLRDHQVLGAIKDGTDIHALCLTSGPHAGIVFSYKGVKFLEEEDKLKINFEYEVHETPEGLEYDKSAFEKELGDFMVELLYYGLEKNHMGFIDSNNEIDATDV